MEKKCLRCGASLSTSRKWCGSCRKQRKREYQKLRYQKLIESGSLRLRYGITNCIFCNKEIIKNRPSQDKCISCYRINIRKTVDNYNSGVKRTKNGLATIGRQAVLDLGFKLDKLVVHHIDEDPSNNKLLNLMIMNRSKHASLHRLLEKNWSLLLKNNNSNLENCWNILRGQLTTAYLEKESANVIKITDIGQSAAEPLSIDKIYVFDVYEEGSETTP